MQALEPTDYIWENFGLSNREKFFSRTKTLLITLLVMCSFYGLIWFLKYYQINNFQNSLTFLIISLGISIIISTMNIFLRLLIRKFVQMEKRTNYTIQEDNIV